MPDVHWPKIEIHEMGIENYTNLLFSYSSATGTSFYTLKQSNLYRNETNWIINKQQIFHSKKKYAIKSKIYAAVWGNFGQKEAYNMA